MRLPTNQIVMEKEEKMSTDYNQFQQLQQSIVE